MVASASHRQFIVIRLPLGEPHRGVNTELSMMHEPERPHGIPGYIIYN